MDEDVVTGAEQDEAADAWRCALNEWETCDNPAPAPAVDALGRRKGGQPPKFCSKAHADRASQLRRRAAVTRTDGALRRFEETYERIAPGIAELLRLADEIRGDLTGRVEAAEREQAEAHTEAVAAQAAAAEAGRRENQARAAAREAVQARQAAELAARRAAEDAERRVAAIAERATESIAEHEAARGAAETERDHALAGQKEAREERDAARRDRDELAVRLRDADQRIEALRAELDERDRRLQAATADLTAAHRQHAHDTAAIENLSSRLAGAEREIERTGRDVQAAQQAAERLTAERDQARTDLAAAQGGHRTQLRFLQEELTAARADAAAQRERAAVAEQRARTAETAARQARELPPLEDIGGRPGVRVEDGTVVTDGEHILLRGVEDRHTREQARALGRALLAISARHSGTPAPGGEAV
ncbi:hypothetical protein GCM10023191_089120 [Actinoallomurus oryzae]|uniref:Uncharacterized protein n=1 Tax=Actinoallomurus oryzae TaxID=502180 RepID=A0ABP8R371_9ACTN